jgi:signal peptidase I
MTTPPKPWLASLLSVLALGTGHLYAAKPRRAALLLAAGLSLLLGMRAIVFRPLGPVLMLALLPAAVALVIWPAVDAWRQAAAWTSGRSRPAYSRWFVLAPFVLLSWVTTGLLRDMLRNRVVEAFRLPSGSMSPTLHPGDYVMVDKRPAARAIERGAVYAFDSVEEPGLQIMKRAVALPGDTVAMRGGAMLINGALLSEPYLDSTPRVRGEDAESRARMLAWQAQYAAAGAGTYQAPDLNDWGPLVVPPGAFLALGDNREASYDSRYYGFVPDSMVLGRPLYIYLSRDTTGTFDWHRIGEWVQ